MKKVLFFALAFGLSLLIIPRAEADKKALTPVGYWKNIDDKTGKPKAIIYIYEQGGKLYGEIVKLIRKKGEEQCPKCTKCRGWRKNKPTCGMLILWNLKNKGDYWGDGKILDPANGKDYRCWIKVLDNGKKLKVRGYIGISLLGRTQYWYRVPKPTKGTCEQVCGKKKKKVVAP